MSRRRKSSSTSSGFTIVSAGWYYFQIRTIDGRALRDAFRYRIDLEPDAPPKATLYGPPNDTEVTVRQRVEVGFVAEDDYGLQRVDLAAVTDGKGKTRRPLHVYRKHPGQLRGRQPVEPAAIPVQRDKGRGFGVRQKVGSCFLHRRHRALLDSAIPIVSDRAPVR